MDISSRAAVPEREHQEIDAGIAALAAEPRDRAPLTPAVRALRRQS